MGKDVAENGIDRVNALIGLPVPDAHSAGLSRLRRRCADGARPAEICISTYIQHKHAPGTPVANDYAMMDYMAKLDAGPPSC